MLFTISIILALILAILCVILSFKIRTHIPEEVFLLLFILFTLYCLSCPIGYITRVKPDTELKQYEKAKNELKLLQSDCDLSFDLVSEYIQDIDEVNENIIRSRKYHDNLYLGPFYYKETADLELLDYKELQIEINL